MATRSGSNLDAHEDRWIFVEAAEGRSQERNGSRAVAALKMVERRSDLDQALQESLLRFLRREPHRFPVFVGFEERVGVKQRKLSNSSP
jgi:hypothetical protein